MKKLILLLIGIITFTSCDNIAEPIKETDSVFTTTYSRQFEELEKNGDVAIYYRESNRLYFKDINNHYFVADITSNTSNTTVPVLWLIITTLCALFICILGVSLINAGLNF